VGTSRRRSAWQRGRSTPERCPLLLLLLLLPLLLLLLLPLLLLLSAVAPGLA
jgi:hypothetical protein